MGSAPEHIAGLLSPYEPECSMRSSSSHRTQELAMRAVELWHNLLEEIRHAS